MVEPNFPDNYDDAAVRCVRLLQEGHVAPGALFTSSENAALASGLTMMITTARYIENTVRASGNLGNVSLMICAKIDRPDMSGTGLEPVEDSVVLHWGQKGNVRNMQGPILAGNERMAAVRQSRQSNFDLRSDDSDNAMDETEARGATASVPMPPHNVNLGEELTVHPAIAAKCLSLLLDGMGHSSHRTSWEEQSYAKLCRGLLSDPVRQVFNAEKQKRFGNEKRGARMKYDDLPPFHLRGKDVTLPIVRLAKKGINQNYEVIETKRVRLRISKPLKNRKEVSFALLCVLLQSTGPQSVCDTVLKQYASEGLTSIGCLRKKESSAAATADCGGPTACSAHDNVKPIVRFFCMDTGPATYVGVGAVDPLCVYLRGEVVPPNSYVVRFKSVESVPRLHGILTECHKMPVLWRRSDIERVMLLGHHGEEIGSAILVDDEVVSPLQAAAERRPPRTIAMDVTNAIVICDLQLHGGVDRCPYPYTQWYNVSSLKRFKFLHFTNRQPPSILNPSSLSNAMALLWHKDRVRKVGP